MKKLLLSSVIMLGVCGIATAQTDAKLAKQPAATSAAPALTPQKAAVMPASDAAVAPAATSTDQQAAAAPAAPKAARVAKTEAASVDAAGVAVPSNDAAKKEAKMAAVKASNEQRTGKQQ